MKETINVSLSSEGSPRLGHYLPQCAIDAIAERFPDCRIGNDRIEFTGDRLSGDIEEIYDIIQKESGLCPRKHKLPFEGMSDRKEFDWKGKREFSKNEIRSAEFTLLVPMREFCISTTYDACGSAVILRKDIKNLPIGFGRQMECFVTDSLKNEMENEGFYGLCFRSVVVSGKMPVKDAEPIWQLWANVELPPMANAKTDIKGVRRDIDCDGINGYYLDDLFYPSIYRYREFDLRRIGCVDCVRTVEHFGSSDIRANRVPRIVCSRRFRDWCIQKKLRLEWVPVVAE